MYYLYNKPHVKFLKNIVSENNIRGTKGYWITSNSGIESMLSILNRASVALCNITEYPVKITV